MTTTTGGSDGISTADRARAGALIQEIASRAVPETADLWPAVQARIGAGVHDRPLSPARSIGGAAVLGGRTMFTRRPALAAALAGGAAAAAALALPALKQGETVSASALLEQARLASEAAAGGTPYHVRATRRLPMKGTTIVTEEVWYAAPDRWRVDAVAREGGTERSRTTTVFSGREAWLVSSAGAETRAVHTTGVAWSTPQQVLPASDGGTASISELLARYGARNCGTAQLRGEATLLGRQAHVVVVTPRPDGCGAPAQKPASGADEKAAKQATPTPSKAAQGAPGGRAPAKAAAGDPENQVKLVQLTVWVDKQIFLPLKLEERDGGTLLDAYEVTSLAVGAAPPDDVFRYTPPAGAQVHRFTGGTPQEVKAALSRT